MFFYPVGVVMQMTYILLREEKSPIQGQVMLYLGTNKSNTVKQRWEFGTTVRLESSPESFPPRPTPDFFFKDCGHFGNRKPFLTLILLSKLMCALVEKWYTV